MYCSQKLVEDFAKFCGLLRLYELYIFFSPGKVEGGFETLKFIWIALRVGCNLVAKSWNLESNAVILTEDPYIFSDFFLEKSFMHKTKHITLKVN